MSTVPENRPLPSSSTPARSEARLHNAGPQRMVMLNPTAGTPHVQFGKVMVFTESAAPLHNTTTFPWTVKQVVADGTAGRFLPDLSSVPEAAPVPLAPFTPAKAETKDFIQHEVKPSNVEGPELPPDTSFSPATQLHEERINRRSRKKKVTRKKHRPKVLKDIRLIPKKPVTVTPKQAKPKQSKRKDQTGRSQRKKKSSNASSTPRDTELDSNDTTSTGRKHHDQDAENPTKITRRRLDFAEGEAVAEYNDETSVFEVSADDANGSVNKLTAVNILRSEESEANIASDLDRPLGQGVLDQSVAPAEISTPLPHRQLSRRELLKKNWMCLARQSGHASDSDQGGFGGVSKLQQLKGQLMLDEREEITSVQGHHNQVDSKDFLLTQLRSLVELPPQCKRKRTMIRSCNRANSSSFAGDQEMVSTDRLQTMDFTLEVALAKVARKRRSKLSRPARRSGFNMSIACYHRLLESSDGWYQGCVGALSPLRVPTRRRTQKRRNCRSISSWCSEQAEQEPVRSTSAHEDLEGSHLLELHNISIQLCQRRSNTLDPICIDLMSQAIVPYTMDDYRDAAAEPQYALVKHVSSGEIIPYAGDKKKRPRAKVDLDYETNRVWNILMGKMVPDVEGSDTDKEAQWEKERLLFRGRADSFITRMRLIQGDRQFSPWKGSVLDSVVGVFLTQNVSDHLSSSVFMNMASKFPAKPKRDDLEQDASKMSTMTQEHETTRFSPQGNTLDETIQDDLNSSGAGEREVKVCPEAPHEEKHISVAIGASNSESQDKSSLENALGQRMQDGLDSFNCKCVNTERREPEVSHEALERTDIFITTIGNPEDKRSLDDAISSQNPVLLSDITSDTCSNSHFKSTNSGSESGNHVLLNTDMMNRAVVDQSYGEIYNQGNDMNTLSENCSAAEQNSEDKRSEGQKSEIVHRQVNSSASNSQLSISQVDSCGLLQTFASESSDSHNVENVNMMSVERISSSMFFENEISNVDTVADQRNCTESFKNSSVFSGQQLSPSMSDVASLETYEMTTKESLKSFCFSIEDEPMKRFQQSEENQDYYLGEAQPEGEFLVQEQHSQSHQVFYSSCDEQKGHFSAATETKPNQDYYLGEIQNEVELLALEQHSQSQQVFYNSCGEQTRNFSAITEIKPKQDYYLGETQPKVQCSAQKQHYQSQQVFYNSCGEQMGNSSATTEIEPTQRSENCNQQNFPAETSNDTPKTKRRKTTSAKAKDFDWDSLRREAFSCGHNSARCKDTMDSIDWEAVRQADVREISNTIKDRGMNNMLAERIKGLLDRLVKDHGSLDLEWLRNVPPDKVKDYLLSIQGLGLKSVECVRLLTLHQIAFPVDTNVGRISVRLGWVPLQPLPESLQLHLLESYPLMETIQKYLWPRLCTLDVPTLYELHYHMITFGKVFCTKSKPNCNACPMRAECRHFASAFASSRLALPAPEERSLVESTLPNAENRDGTIINPTPLLQIEQDSSLQGTRNNSEPIIEETYKTEQDYSLQGMRNNNEPIIEEPPSPQFEHHDVLESDIEEAFYENPDEIPIVRLNMEEVIHNLRSYMQENTDFEASDIEKAIFAIPNGAASIPMPKLKNVRRLRTVHQVYELPDGHPLLEGLEPRESDDPCPYLLSIWTPGETAQSVELPQASCNSQEPGKLCEGATCFSCNARREEQSQIIRGTLLIPCRTANRGSFPLNGTYFQVNEVFADHASSHNPLVIPRRWIWNLPRRFVYFGTSIPTIFRGLLMEEIQLCFSRGFVCIRGFDRKARAPRPLCPRLHLAPSHLPKEKRAPRKYKNKAKPAEDSP